MSELVDRKDRVVEVCTLSNCPVMATMSAIGGKWKPAILRSFQLNGTMRFGQLKRSIPEVTQKMLTQQLRELERDGLVWRKVYAEVPPRVEYGRTPFGKTLDPVLSALATWGMAQREG